MASTSDDLTPVVIETSSGAGITEASQATPATSGWASASVSPWLTVTMATTPVTAAAAPTNAGHALPLRRVEAPLSSAMRAPMRTETGRARCKRASSLPRRRSAED